MINYLCGKENWARLFDHPRNWFFRSSWRRGMSFYSGHTYPLSIDFLYWGRGFAFLSIYHYKYQPHGIDRSLMGLSFKKWNYGKRCWEFSITIVWLRLYIKQIEGRKLLLDIWKRSQ